MRFRPLQSTSPYEQAMQHSSGLDFVVVLHTGHLKERGEPPSGVMKTIVLPRVQTGHLTLEAIRLMSLSLLRLLLDEFPTWL